MKITRAWSMASHNTFTIPPIRDLLREHLAGRNIILDPFARNSKAATITNDLNPETSAQFHMDAIEFFQMFEENSIDCILYDPPYSPRQVSECYKGVGRQVTALDTSAQWRKRHLDEIQRILRPEGKLISFGWNSAGAGKKRGFEIIEVLLISHGGSHNDTICTVEVKTEQKQKTKEMHGQHTLEGIQ